jgi:adenylate cyclase
MLKPRNITAAILFAFIAIMGVRHFTFAITAESTNSSMQALNALESIPLLSWIERTDYDMHLRFRSRGKPNPAVVMVDVNERSIRELGQFPFGRKIYAKLIRNLEKYGAKVAAFDITFPEVERNDSLAAMVSARQELAKAPGAAAALKILDSRIGEQNGDAAFAHALSASKMPVVLGFAFTSRGVDGAKTSDDLKKFFAEHSIFRSQVADNAFVHDMTGRLPVVPHKGLRDSLSAGSTIGFFTADPDQDSVIRQAVGALHFENIALTSLAVRAVASYLGVEPALVGESGYHIRDREGTGKLDVPLSPSGTYLLAYYGGERLFPYIEFSDVVSDDPAVQSRMAKELNGKIVFVGVSAVGLKDIRANPFSKDYPGVEVHATFASNMLDGTYLVKDDRFFYLGYAFILLLGLIASALVYRMQPLIALGLTVALTVAFQFACQDIFFDNGLVVPTFLPCLAAIAVFVGGVLFRYFTEEQEKKKVRNAFGRYVSGPVVEEILRDQSKLRLGGQKKVLTVMFCDLVGFTKMSEHMDAEKLTLLLNEYFTRMTRIILANQGTLDKYMGDAVMCFWGAPLDIPDHARLACKTAIEMTAELDKINAEWKQKYDVTIGLRIGVHTGEMNVGNMGSEQVFSYTVMGDNVNLGSRLEGVNNVYGTQIMVSAATAKAAGQEFMTRTLDSVRVKGKEEAVEIRELLGFNRGVTPEWMQAFADAVSEYQKGNWDAAQAGFARCLELRPGDAPSETFLERVKELRAHPPKDWDGTWTLSSK